MRIIAGKFKGKKLIAPNSKLVRPTADMVREAVFAILFDKVENASFLDLFCGSGAIGIEALSRGAKEVVFVDNFYSSIKATKENLQNVGEKAVVVKKDFKDFLNACQNKFDIIYIDPPYASGYYEKALELIFNKNLLNDQGIIICEFSNLNFNLNQQFFEVYDERKYGSKKLVFLKHK